jgi:hypothetical protein
VHIVAFLKKLGISNVSQCFSYHASQQSLVQKNINIFDPSIYNVLNIFLGALGVSNVPL